MCIHLENNNEHNSMWHSFTEIQCSTILHCTLLCCISVTIGLIYIYIYIYIYTSNSYKLNACHLHLLIPAIVSAPSIQVKTTLPWGWFCCQAPSQILAAAKCQNGTALQAFLLTQWHTPTASMLPPKPVCHTTWVLYSKCCPNCCMKTTWKDAERYWINCIKITWKCWRKFLALNSHLEIMRGRQ